MLNKVSCVIIRYLINLIVYDADMQIPVHTAVSLDSVCTCIYPIHVDKSDERDFQWAFV